MSSPSNVNVTSDVIHSMLYKARPDINAIVHHHTTAVVAVSALQSGLQYLTQDSSAFYGRVAYHPWEGLRYLALMANMTSAAFQRQQHSGTERNGF